MRFVGSGQSPSVRSGLASDTKVALAFRPPTGRTALGDDAPGGRGELGRELVNQLAQHHIRKEVCCQHNTTSASGASAEAELAARIGDRPSVQALAAAPRRPHPASTTPGCGAAPSRRSTSADGLLRVIVGTDPIVSYPAPPAAPTLANAARETSSCRRVSRAALTSPGLVVR